MPSPSYEFAHCVVCGHANAEVIADHESLRAEVESLWEFHDKRLRTGTPTDRLMDRVAFSEHAPVRLVRCNDCGLIYRNPVERTHELREIYAHAAPSPDVLRSLHATQLPALRAQATELKHVMGRGGSVLEVGSYVGAFLAAARERGLTAEGVDINADVNRFTRTMGFAVHDGELDSVDPERTFDAIAIWNTFDQLADPRRVVNAASKLLSPGGVFVVRVPNGAFYDELRPALTTGNSLQRTAAREMLAQNNLLTFPYRWGFTERSLRSLFGESGFDVVRVRGDVLVPIADEWTRSWARVEEVGVKAMMRVVSRLSSRYSPWIEVYARR